MSRTPVAQAVRASLALRRRVVVAAADVRLRSERRALAAEKAQQREAFARLATAASARLSAIRELDRPTFSVPMWREHVASLEVEFSPSPPFDFLRHPRILSTMFILAGGSMQRRELAGLQARFAPGELSALTAEELVGDPVLMNRRYRTTHQTIHHLYHLHRFLEATGLELDALDTVVEWGAGYGNQARVFRRLHGGAPTQILIDLPLFSLIQWLYLATVHGPDAVVLHDSAHGAIRPGAINLVPVGLTSIVPEADLFVSTWALSETARPAQDHVIDERDWFGARHLLLAHQTGGEEFPEAERVGALAAAQGARWEDLQVMRGSKYAFR